MARELNEVGVVGLGTMGAGIAEVLARAGLSVTAVEIDDEARRARPRPRRAAPPTARSPRQARPGRPRRDPRADPLQHRRWRTSPSPSWSSRPCPSAWSSRPRSSPQLDKICPPDTILATNTSSLSVTELVGRHRPAGQGHRHALLQPGAGHEAGRGRAHRRHRAVGRRGRRGARRAARQGRRHHRRPGRASSPTRCCSATSTTPSSMYENRYASREDIDAAMRLGCGLPMGPLALMDLIGLDTAYEILDTMYKQSRDRLHAPSPILKQMITAGLLGRKSGRGFYTYAEPGSAEVVADAATPAAGGAAEGARAGADASASSAPARWPPASSRSSPRPATTSCFVARSAGEGRGRARRRWPSRWRSRCSAASSTRPPATTSSAGSPARRRSTISPTATWSSRPSSRTLPVKQALFANLDEIAKPGAVLATTTSSLPVIECATASGAARRRRSACTSSTRRR